MSNAPRSKAETALAAAREDPAAALSAAAEVLDHATSDEELATAHFACGLAHRTFANGAESTTHLEQAATYAAQLPELLGQILRSLAFNYAQAGDNDRADHTILRSIHHLKGQEADLSRLQQAFMLIMRGDHQRALPVLTTAIGGFEQQENDDYLELTLYNRALIFMEFGDYDASIADLERAYEIATRLDHPVSAADAALHLSQVLGWRDDIPGAMHWHARSVALRTAAGASNAVADTEHAFVLIQARLMREAEQILTDSLPRLEAAGDNEAVLVAGRLLLVEVLLHRGSYPEALRQIELAAAETPVEGRWRFDVAAAEHRVRIASGEASTELLQQMVATASEMAANGERHAAAIEQCQAINVALAIGNHDEARRLADTVRRFSRNGPLWLQIQVWTALAQLRFARGNRRGAAAALRAGMTRLDAYRSGIGSTDLRLHASEFGDKLAALGIELTVGSGSLSRLFSWSERLRTRPTATVTPEGGELGKALADLRRAAATARRAGPADMTAVRRSIAGIENRVRQLARESVGSTSRHGTVELTELQAALDRKTLVDYIIDRDTLYALVVRSADTRLISLGSVEGISGLIDHLRFSAERIARPSTSPRSLTAALLSAQEVADSLRDRLVTPLGWRGEPVVIIPTGPLYGIPWAIMFDAPVVTAPAASTWLAAIRRPVGTDRSVVITGPGLPNAVAEATEIAAITGATIGSSVEEAIKLLQQSSAVHFACHAHARTDSPLFSSLVLEDGALTLYDIERLDRVPATIVLAACSGGGSLLASGDEVLSLAGAFLDIGARTVVAPMFTVSDAVTRQVMTQVYRSVAEGSGFAEAIRVAAADDDPGLSFTAGSFTCFGAG